MMRSRPGAIARRPQVILLLSLTLLASACAGRGPVIAQPWDFTTDGLEATTDAAAALADGSTKATKELLGPLKRMMASMQPGGHGVVRDHVKVVAFVVANHERLRIDIARGGGEHLSAFAHLIRVPADNEAPFTMRLQGQYASLYDADLPPGRSFDRLLTAHYDADWRTKLSAPSP